MRTRSLVLAALVLVACKPTPTVQQEQAVGFAALGQVGPFVIPASWKQATWALDGSNGSGCASDNNRTCSSASCTSGDGPCLTFGSILTRWGTYSPLIQQKTMLTIMSSMVYPDTIYAQPRIQYASGVAPSANFIVSCNLPTATWSGAIGTVTAKNRATPQLLTTNLSSFTGVATNQLLINTTHPSEAWTYQVASGSTWDISQPVTGCDTAASFPCPTPLTEVNTWTTGDTVSAYTPYTIYMSSLEPINQSDILPSSLVIGCALEGYNPSPFVSYVPFRSNATVTFSNDLEGALTEYTTSGNAYQGSNSQVAPTFDNNSYLAFITGMFNPIFDAGILANQNFSISQYFRDGVFEDDVILASLTATQIDGFYGANSTEFDNFFNGVYITTGITQLGGFIISHGPFWGPGYLHVNAGSTFGTRFGTFTQYFLQQGATQLNASTTACAQESTTTFTCGINLTPANLDGSLISGGFNGTAFALGAGQITSVQQTP